MKLFKISITFIVLSLQSVYANEKSEITTTPAIIITAHGFDEDFGMIQTTEFTQEDILLSPSKNLVDVASLAPNVERAGNVRASNSEFRIRGMEDTRITTKIDGSKTNFRGEYKGRNFIAPFMLSGLSVTRGSNSVVDSSGAIAGSVNFKTKDVEDISLYKGQRFGGELFSSYSTNGSLRNYAGSTFAQNNDLSILGMYSFAKNNNFYSGKGVILQGNEEIEKNILIPYTENTQNNGIIKIKKRFSSSEFLQFYSSLFKESGESTSNPFRLANGGEAVNRNLTNIREAIELNLAYFNLKAFYDKTNLKEDLISGNRTDTTNFTSFGFDAFGKYSYKARGLHNMFIYGIDFAKDEQSGKRGGNANRAFTFPTGTTYNQGIFAENALDYKRLKVLLGGRFDSYKLKSEGNALSYNSGLLKKASIGYELLDGFIPFVRYSEGYRAPLVKETFASGNILQIPNPNGPFPPFVFSLNLLSNKDLKAEYSQNYEAGFKFQKDFYMEGDGIFIDGVYFVEDINNFIIQDPNCTAKACVLFPTAFNFQYQNLNKVRFKGVESSLKLKYNGYLLAIAGSTVNAYEVGNNNNLLQIPGNKIVITLGKKFENGFFIGIEGASGNGVDKSDFRTYALNIGPIPFNSNCGAFQLCEKTDSYRVLNANVEYTKKTSSLEYKIGSSVNNIFNTYYKQQSSFIPSMGRNIMFYGQIKF